MNKLLTLIFILVSIASFAQDEVESTIKLQGSKELPLELNLLIQSIQSASTADEQFNTTIMKIDSYARLLSKEDIFLVGKIEIYKTLLKTNEVRPKATLDGDSIKNLKASLKLAKDPFIKWFIQALLHDTDSLMSTATYKEYLLQRNNGKLEKLELRKIDKKVQLLSRWISRLNPESSDFESVLKAELLPVMDEALKNIEQSFFLLASNTGSGKIAVVNNLKELKFFSVQRFKPAKAPVASKEKSVDDILAPLTNENPAGVPTLPEPSKEDWLNDDNAPANLKNLPKPADDADWLQDI